MERDYQSGHLTVLLSTTGTGIPGSSCPTPIRRRPQRAAERPPTLEELITWLSEHAAVSNGDWKVSASSGGQR